MINDFYLVYEGLKDAGEEPKVKHNDISSPGMGTTFRVCLEKNGTVGSIEHLTKDKIKDTWTLGDGNKNQFPAVKFEYPFKPNGNEEYMDWKKDNKNPDAASYKQFILTNKDKYSTDLPNIDSWPVYRSKILKRKELLETILFSIDGGYHVFELFQRYSNIGDEGKDALTQLSEQLIDLAVKGSDKNALKAIADALFGDQLDTKGRVKESKRITYLIDCLPQSEIDIYASSIRRVPVLSDALFSVEKATTKKRGRCAITGRQAEIVSKKFPSEKLSVIGNTILLTKNSGTSGPTVARYGAAGSNSFPLDKRLSENIAASVSFLTAENLNKKTWQKIPSSVGSKQSLLLAYCRTKYDLAIVPAITGGDIEDFDDYQDATETVIALLSRGDCTPDDAVAICEIRPVDKANRKINYSALSSVGKISEAANQWMTACKNIPSFKLISKIGNEVKPLFPWPIAPIDVLYLTKNKYIRDGLSSTPVSSVTFSDAMVLFMSKDKRVMPLSLFVINKLATQVEPLFEYCALSKNKNRIDKKITKPDRNTLALKTVTLFGALLCKLGRKKEDYMTNFAYQFGQLCSAMDELHIGYCQSERKGDIPNTLIGNTTYNVALQNPVKAMGILASRINPYKVWAKKTRSKQKKIDNKAILAGLAASKWIEGHSAILADHFSDSDPLVNDTYKAELMLGYLAGRPFLAKANKQ